MCCVNWVSLQVQHLESVLFKRSPKKLKWRSNVIVLTFGRDGEHSVRRGRAVHVGGVPDGAGVGAVVLQGGVGQRDGGVAPSRSPLPGDTTSKLALRRGEGPGREVEELQQTDTVTER